MSWNVAQTLNFRDGMYYALTGDTFDGKKAEEIGLRQLLVSHGQAEG